MKKSRTNIPAQILKYKKPKSKRTLIPIIIDKTQIT